MPGIQETKEVLTSLNEFNLVIAKHLKDGVQKEDIPAIIVDLIASDAFKTSLAKAVENITVVPAEILDIDMGEGFELAQEQVAYIPKLLAALKK
jgi:hypothetical protein